MQEVWKDIENYVGFYQVSNLGNVRSLDRVLDCGRKVNGRLMKVCGSPYLHVSLTKNGICKDYRVHRLVAEAFIPNRYNYPCVNHKDENKLNNHVDNLEWCTYSYNNDYSGVLHKATLAKLGKHLSDEHKKRMSETLKASGKQRAEKRKHTMQMRYPNGIKMSEEQRKKISDAMKGRPKSEETKRRMRKPKSDIAKQHMREAQLKRYEQLTHMMGGE